MLSFGLLFIENNMKIFLNKDLFFKCQARLMNVTVFKTANFFMLLKSSH